MQRKNTVEYEGGSQPTQIGDLNVEEQIQLSEIYMPEYNAEENGYYFHSSAICAECAKKLRNLKVYDKNHILFRYVDKIYELNELKENLLSDVLRELRKNISEDVLSEIDFEAYQNLKNKKHFGKKKKNEGLLKSMSVRQNKSFIHIYNSG